MSFDSLLAKYIRGKEIEKNKKNGDGKNKELDDLENSIIAEMKRNNLTFRQIGNRYVSIEEKIKPPPPKDFEMMCMMSFVTNLHQTYSRRHPNLSSDQVRKQISDVFSMNLEEIPKKYAEFRDMNKKSNGTKTDKLVISETRPYQSIVKSLYDL